MGVWTRVAAGAGSSMALLLLPAVTSRAATLAARVSHPYLEDEDDDSSPDEVADDEDAAEDEDSVEDRGQESFEDNDDAAEGSDAAPPRPAGRKPGRNHVSFRQEEERERIRPEVEQVDVEPPAAQQREQRDARSAHKITSEFMKRFARNMRLAVLSDSQGDMDEHERRRMMQQLQAENEREDGGGGAGASDDSGDGTGPGGGGGQEEDGASDTLVRRKRNTASARRKKKAHGHSRRRSTSERLRQNWRTHGKKHTIHMLNAVGGSGTNGGRRAGKVKQGRLEVQHKKVSWAEYRRRMHRCRTVTCMSDVERMKPGGEEGRGVVVADTRDAEDADHAVQSQSVGESDSFAKGAPAGEEDRSSENNDNDADDDEQRSQRARDSYEQLQGESPTARRVKRMRVWGAHGDAVEERNEIKIELDPDRPGRMCLNIVQALWESIAGGLLGFVL